MSPRRPRNSSSVCSSDAPRLRSYAASFETASIVDVAHAGIERDPQQVPVRAELVVAHHGRLAAQHGRTEQRVPRLLEPVGDGSLADADGRDPDRRPAVRASA